MLGTVHEGSHHGTVKWPMRVSEYDPVRGVIKIAGREVRVGGPIPKLKEGEKLVRYTQSICPYCYSLLPAVIVEREGKYFIRKVCPEHGEIEEVYQGDAEFARRIEKWYVEGRGTRYVYTDLTAPCPFSCGLCPIHKNHTALANLVLTNRCNLDCWYCLPGDQEVLVKVNGVVKVARFEELGRRYTFPHKVSIDGFRGEYVVPNDLEVLTYRGGRASWARVTKFLRRHHDGELITIRTRSGKVVKVTPEHKVIVYGGGLSKKEAGSLRRGDRLLSVKSLSSAAGEGGGFVVDEVEAVGRSRFSGVVYDLEVDSDSHTFVVGDGLLVSNCFFYAEKLGFVYEPTIEQIKHMVGMYLKQGVTPVIQLTGGEPTLREDIVEIVRLLREMGVKHIQLNTNGIKFASMYLFEGEESAVKYARALRESGVNTVYMSFDGITPRANPKNHWEVPFILEVFRKAGMTSVVLVPTLIKGVNMDEVGDVIRFAAMNTDVVRAVNFQPVSLTGMIKKAERERLRVTMADAVKAIEEQTGGQITVNDWFPVPASVPISAFSEGLAGRFKFEMANHPECGVATYVYARRGSNSDLEFIPISRLMDVEGFLNYLFEKAGELKKGGSRFIVGGKMLFSIITKYINWGEVPGELKRSLPRMLLNIFSKQTYEALGEWHYKFLFLGMMHFMDLYNYDVERVMRCNIHYLMPDGRVVPFCTFNVLNEVYRDYVQKRYMFTLDEWRRMRGEDTLGEAVKYRRSKELLKKMMTHELYIKTYKPFISRWAKYYPWLKEYS